MVDYNPRAPAADPNHRSCCCHTTGNDTTTPCSAQITALKSELDASLALLQEHGIVLQSPKLVDNRTNGNTSLTSNPHNCIFESLPPEAMSRIVCYTTSETILPLCQAIPSLHKLRSAIIETARAFPFLGISRIWPTFWFPVEFHQVNNNPCPSNDTTALKGPPGPPLFLSSRDLSVIANLTRLLTRYNGVAKVQAYSIQHLESMTDLLPRVIDLYIGAESADEYFRVPAAISTTNRRNDSYLDILTWIENLQNQQLQQVKHTVKTLAIRMLDLPSMENTGDMLAIAESNVGRQAEFWRCFDPSQFDEEVADRLEEFQNLKGIEFRFDLEMNCSRKVIDKLPFMKNLKRVSFEVLDEGGYQWIEELGAIGWKVRFGECDSFFGSPCVVWEKCD
ncbi:hypothetical protein BDR26DRAFT_890041 [Obelidium mucronatum]|nr:hypothetical protein BDR26DRAFT_890041 [Obelidium mucronatum]